MRLIGTTLAKLTVFPEGCSASAMCDFLHAVLVVGAVSDEVHLVPLRRALQEHPDGSVLVFGGNAPTER